MVAVRSAGALYYIYSDHLGSVVGMTNATGGFVSGSSARYDPFGNYRTWPGSNVNPLISDRGFTGHVHDNTGEYPTQNVGLIYMNARYYLPEIGRFISADTIVPEASNPQSYNRYAYVRNNPVNFTDPTGNREIGADENDLRPYEPPPPPTPIWTGAILDDGPDWVQPPGETTHGVIKYPNNFGIHTGADWGKSVETFTGDPFQYPVYAGCECMVLSITAPAPGFPYRPWRVNLASTINEYSDFELIYGHLAEIQVSVGQVVTPETIIGYLETTEHHVHIEIRRISDNAYVNPWPYFSSDLKSQMRNLIDEDTFVPGGRLGYPPFGYYGVQPGLR